MEVVCRLTLMESNSLLNLSSGKFLIKFGGTAGFPGTQFDNYCIQGTQSSLLFLFRHHKHVFHKAMPAFL